VTRHACTWLEDAGAAKSDKPWTLFVSWLRPHYPLICPEAFYHLYPLSEMDEARFMSEKKLHRHPVTQAIRGAFNYDERFDDQTRQIARASYYGLCSLLDAQVGAVMNVLEQTGQADNTLVIYTSDHGDHNGDRRMWTKMSLYDESARIPMLVQGPDIPKAKTIETLASLVDIYPTVLQAVDAVDDEIDRPGLSLRSLIDGAGTDRGVLSEYHDGGSPVGMFMWRKDQWKYNCYPGYAPELFDLAADPDELCDLSQDPAYSQDLKRCQDDMGALLDPGEANDLAFSDQAERISQLGGVEAILASEEFDHTPTPSG